MRTTLNQHRHICGTAISEKLLDQLVYCANNNCHAVHLWPSYEIRLALQTIMAFKTQAKHSRSSV